MISRLFKYFLVLIFSLFSVIFITPLTSAQEDIYFFSIKNLDINAEVQLNGDLKVSESLVFTDQGSNYFWWVINSEKVNDLKIYQDNKLLSKKSYDVKRVENQVVITSVGDISPTNIWKIEYNLQGQFKPQENDMEFRYEPIKNPGITIDNLNVSIKFPQNLNPQTTKQNLYAIHGIENSEFMFYQNVLLYRSQNLSSYSSFTCIANLDKNIVNLPISVKILAAMNLAGLDFWLISTIALPLLTLIILGLMVYIKRKREHISVPAKKVTTPPSQMDPILVGVLFRQTLSAREIAAEILHLAINKYLMVVQEYSGYTLGERSSLNSLKSYDKSLTDELLKGRLKETLSNLKELPQKELFSEAINNIYNKAYDAIAYLGYFVKNPQIVFLKYKIFGIATFFLSALAFFLAPIFVDPPYIVFAFLGTAIASLIIIKMSTSMPRRTKEGQKTLEDWLAFRKFLIEYPKVAGYSEIHQDKFNQYLPFAIVLNCEKEWADHFSHIPFSCPDWYSSYYDIDSLGQFTKQLYPLIETVSQTFLALKEPIL